MKKFRIKFFILSVLSGFLLAISFPKINAFYFAWVAFVPLLFCCSSKSTAKQALFYGFITGFVCYCVSCIWLLFFLNYHFLFFQAILFSFIIYSYYGFFYSLWAVSFNYIQKKFNATIVILFSSASWVFIEFVRTYLLTFGWNLIGYSQSSFKYIIQVSDITGVYGVSFVVILVNMLMYYWLQNIKEKKYLIVAVCVFVVIFIYGYVKFNKYSSPYGEKISVGIVQPNIDQYKKWSTSYRNKILNTLKQNAAIFKNKQVDLIAYPETVLPGSLEYKQNIRDVVKETANYSKLSLIGGSSFSNHNGTNMYNSIFAITKEGLILDKHNKNHLIIFGEFVPFRKVLPKYFRTFNSLGDFSKDSCMNVFNYDNLFIGSTICSENFFPNLSRKLVLNGAKILTNHANDAWFLDSFAPYQHFVMNVFRAVENRKNMIVSANTGLSAIIDSAGNISNLTKLNENISLISNAYQNSDITIYTKIGNIFVYICIMFVVIILFIIKRKK